MDTKYIYIEIIIFNMDIKKFNKLGANTSISNFQWGYSGVIDGGLKKKRKKTSTARTARALNLNRLGWLS